MNKFWNSLLLLLFLSVSAEAVASYKDTVFVRYSGQNGEKSTIVVQRGCHVEEIDVAEYVPNNESQSQLLTRAYGQEPLKDSSEIYDKWHMQCSYVHGENQEGWVYVFLGALYGPPAIYFGYNLLTRDYDYTVTTILGYTGGAVWLVTGALMAFASAIMLIPSIAVSLTDDSPKRSEEYREKSKKWKLRITPAINLREPGGGLLLQLGF